MYMTSTLNSAIQVTIPFINFPTSTGSTSHLCSKPFLFSQGRIPLGDLWGLETPYSRNISEKPKQWYKNTLKCIISDISVLYEIKQPIFSKGLHPPHPTPYLV